MGDSSMKDLSNTVVSQTNGTYELEGLAPTSFQWQIPGHLLILDENGFEYNGQRINDAGEIYQAMRTHLGLPPIN